MAGGALLQSVASSAGNGNEWNCRGISGNYLFTIETSNATVSAGGVTFEEAPSSGYAGTWAPIAAEILPVANSVITVRVTGAFNIVRARISTGVTGGAKVTCRVQTPVTWEGA